MPTRQNDQVETPETDDGPAVAAVFAPGGPVSGAIGDFEPRPQQAEMAVAVYRAISGRSHLVVEAGTGVGKSLAYLIPSAVWAARNKKKVIVATHTKALQAQLVKKDLPVVKAILAAQGLPLSYFLLMGSSNYLCRSRLERAAKPGPELFDDGGGGRALQELLEWARIGDSGCRPELPFAVAQAVWAEVCRDADICLGKRCPLKSVCFYRKDVALAAKADLIVVNQHLFFAGMPLPAFDAVVFDEAHNLEDVASAFMGFSLTDRKLKRFLDDIFSTKSGKGLAGRITRPPANWLSEVRQAVADVSFASKAFFRELREKLGLEAGEKAATKAVRVHKPAIVGNSLEQPLLALTVLLSQALGYSQSDLEEAEIKAHMKRCMDLGAEIAAFLACKESSNAYWVEAARTKKHQEVSLNMAPVDVSEALRKELFGKNFPVILTSATLAVDGSFSMLKSRLGLDKSLELLLDSPFEYDKQVALLIPQTIPDPADTAAYEAAVIEACSKLAAAVEGGIFLLFTSWQSLERAWEALAKKITGRPLFRQGDKLPVQLLTDFKRAGNGVLFATDTFWQGVDVPGQALACVVVTRLPFISPDTPLEEARKEWMTARGLNFFADYTLPKAVVKFRQGFGRLIRTRNDFGAVAVLDPRIRTRRYGAKFTRSIPRCRNVATPGELKAFFALHGRGYARGEAGAL